MTRARAPGNWSAGRRRKNVSVSTFHKDRAHERHRDKVADWSTAWKSKAKQAQGKLDTAQAFLQRTDVKTWCKPTSKKYPGVYC